MTIFVFSALLLVCSLFAGLLGSLTGLGGGVVIIPVLVLFFHIDIHYAMGASLISVIATSSGTATTYIRDGYTNIRIGMFLEIAAVIGALIGALLIPFVSKLWLTVLFSLVLFLSAYLTVKRKEELEGYKQSHPWAIKLKLDGTRPVKNKITPYFVQNVPTAFSIMGFAGLISGLLGVGSGTLKVLAMDQALRLPYKVATTTSNFMIGITAAVSASLYFSHGYINPAISFPVMLGVLIGAYVGARIIGQVQTHILRVIFSVVICLIGLQMLFNAITGAL